jgi:microcystin-dependent protein
MTTSIITRLGTSPEEGIKAPVKATSSGNLALFDVGMTIAGYVVQDNDRIAVNAQTDSTENGIYNAKQGTDWIRATDFNNSDDVVDGQLITDENTSSVYTISLSSSPWQPGLNSVAFGLLLTPVGFFWGSIGGTLSNQADLQAELDAKAALVHTHVEADITDLQAYLLDAAGSIAMDGELYARRDTVWEIIDFSVFAPAVHTHVEADITDLQPYLLDAAGSIALDDQLWVRANADWQAISVAGGTVGEILAWPDTDPPENFLTCDGSSQNAVTFADLFAVLGYKFGGSGANFNLPDLRGEFIRGTDNGRTADPDAAARTDRGDGTTGDQVGTKQAQALGPHNHTFSAQQNIGGFTDNGGAPDQRSTQQNASTGSSGTGIGGDTRPRNVYMNYIIRFTGGGSGITQPPTIEVQDNGVTLTTAAQLFNFINFNVTQPIVDQIDIRFGSSAAAGTYCPGYSFTYVNTFQWQIDNYDVRQLFSIGRRLSFTDGASLYYGEITGVQLSGSDTLLTMDMEGTDILTASITEVCLVSGSAAWSPISGDPFSGGPIRDITAGLNGGQVYWVIVGLNGLLATSIDKGVTWQVQTTGHTEDFNQVAYNSLSETFIAVADNGTFNRSTDGTTWALDTTSVPGVGGGSSTYNVSGVYYDQPNDWWAFMYAKDAGENYGSMWSDDDGVTWNAVTGGGSTLGQGRRKIGVVLDVRGSFGSYGMMSVNVSSEDIYVKVNAKATFQVLVNTSGKGQALSWMGMPSSPTTDGFTVGYASGEVRNGITAGGSPTFGSGVLDWTYSPIHSRYCGVCRDGKIITGEGDVVTPVWTSQPNNSDVLADINCVHWDDSDGVFICGNSLGQIMRSTTGVASPSAAPTFTGFTLIAADPFTGSPITHIIAGSISGQVYWIAAGGSLMFVSTDAGVTWNAITHGASGTVVSLAYSAAEESFMAGFSGGDYSYTYTGGTTWTADTTSVAALGLTGSNSIKGLHYFEDTGQWMIIIPSSSGSIDSQYRTSDITAPAWTTLDGAVSQIVPEIELQPAKDGADNRVFFQDGSTGIPYNNDGNDTTSVSYINVGVLTVPRTALKVEAGTVVSAPDIYLGNAGGDVSFVTNTIEYTVFGLLAGAIRGFAFASASDRYVVVGDAGEIKTRDNNDPEDSTQWFEVVNPFTANINAVWYDASDDMIIAVGSNGEIGRSVDGIS